MWSCRLSKIKSSRFKRSIANSESLAETQRDESSLNSQASLQPLYFFSKMGNWQYLLELFIASNVLALLLALAKAQSWSHLQAGQLLQHILYINWILLAFAAFLDLFKNKLQQLNSIQRSVFGFFLLQGIVFLTTIVLNIVHYWGTNFSFNHFSGVELRRHLILNLSYGVLLGAFCLRYLYIREQWFKQRNSELNARVQAMQARIHPHFLFNSMNSVVSLISIDPDKAEQMLIDLSKLFRVSFQELRLVSLQEEIELCQKYIAIEKIRLGQRLVVEWNIQQIDQLCQVKIPLLTLQPLIENSIFHGVEKKLVEAKIGILVEILQNQVTIVITNPFIHDKLSLREGHGIALENVKQRLKAHFGQSVQFRSFAGKALFTTVVQYRYK